MAAAAVMSRFCRNDSMTFSTTSRSSDRLAGIAVMCSQYPFFRSEELPAASRPRSRAGADLGERVLRVDGHVAPPGDDHQRARDPAHEPRRRAAEEDLGPLAV